MAAESEVIQKLHYQVDNYDEQQKLLQSSEGLSKKMASDPHQHVQLCSPDTNRTIISAYNLTLQQEHGITNFLESFSPFSKRNNWESDTYSYKVGFNVNCLSSCTNRSDDSLSLMLSHL
jgi:hypothetical protein